METKTDNKRLTIRDIANEAGVSTTTVSRFLNGKYESMQDSTRQRISRIIRETGYVPNPMANALRTNKTDLIGLVMSNIKGSRTPTLIAGVCEACAKNGKKVLLVDSNGDEEQEQRLVHDLLEHRVAGLLVVSGNSYPFYREIYNSRKIPVVLADRVPADSQIPSVAIDHASAAARVVRHLAEKGYRRLVLIQQPHFNPNNTPKLRAAAAEAAWTECLGAGAQLRQHSLRINEDSVAESLEALAGIVLDDYRDSERIPTAIFSVELAIMEALVNLCYQHGLQLSEHFTVAGYGDWKTRALLPGACVIEQPLAGLGSVAAQRLFQLIETREQGGRESPEHLLLETKITLN